MVPVCPCLQGKELTAALVADFGGHFTSELVRAFGTTLTAKIVLCMGAAFTGDLVRHVSDPPNPPGIDVCGRRHGQVV